MNDEIPQRIFDTVRRLIADSLAQPIDDIRLDSALVDDLGADSLDFVDLIFAIDHELDIRVRDSEFNFLTRLDFSSEEVMKHGFLTQPITDKLAEWLPALRDLPDRSQVTPRQLFSLITVEAICLVVARRAKPA